MYLRPYTSHDFQKIIELFYNTVHAINKKDYTVAQLNAWAPKDMEVSKWQNSLSEHYTLVCENQGMIVGFGDIDESGYLDRLYVHKDYQRCKVATMIVDALEEHARQTYIKMIVTDASITARPFFEKRGYEVIRQQKVERRGEALINFKMKKIL